MADVSGNWRMTVNAPNRDWQSMVTIEQSGDSFTGKRTGTDGASELQDGKIDGNRLTWKMDVTKPQELTLECDATVDGDSLSGNVKAGRFGEMPLSGERAG